MSQLLAAERNLERRAGVPGIYHEVGTFSMGGAATLGLVADSGSDWLAQMSGVASVLAGLDMTMPGIFLKFPPFPRVGDSLSNRGDTYR